MPVLYGVLMYMGVNTLRGMQFIDRLALMLMPTRYIEFEEYDADAHHGELLLPIFVSFSPTGTSLTMLTCATFHSTRCEIINIMNSQSLENLYDHYCSHD